MAEPILGIIYKITNLLNGKVYIGQTKTLLRLRLNSHKYEARRKRKMLIGQAITKYGWENFKAEILEAQITLDHIDARESFWIQEHGTLSPNGYNLESGGFTAKIVSAETREKMAAAKRGKKRGPHSEETRRRISESQKGKKISQEQIDGMRQRMLGHKAWNAGKSWSKETRAKISASMTGVKHDQDRCLRKSVRQQGVGNPFFGKHHTAESKKLIAANRKVTDELRAKISLGVRQSHQRRKEINAIPGR